MNLNPLKPIMSSKDVKGIIVKKSDLFVGVSAESLVELISHRYVDSMDVMRQSVQKYIGSSLPTYCSDAKVRQAYQRIKTPPFCLVKEILNIIS